MIKPLISSPACWSVWVSHKSKCFCLRSNLTARTPNQTLRIVFKRTGLLLLPVKSCGCALQLKHENHAQFLLQHTVVTVPQQHDQVSVTRQLFNTLRTFSPDVMDLLPERKHVNFHTISHFHSRFLLSTLNHFWKVWSNGMLIVFRSNSSALHPVEWNYSVLLR